MPREKDHLPPHRQELLYSHPSQKQGQDIYDVEEWKNSVYYFWWEYLRRHEGYKASCENDGKGEHVNIYADFGNIHATDFVTWWHGRGRALFVEPISIFQAREIISKDDRPNYGNPHLVILEIPVNQHLSSLVKKIKAIVKKRQKERGVSFATIRSHAKFPVYTRPVIATLRKELEVWDMRKAHPKMKLWEIGKQVKGINEGNPGRKYVGTGEALTFAQERAAKRKLLTQLTSRHLKNAERRIYYVGLGQFPRVK